MTQMLMLSGCCCVLNSADVYFGTQNLFTHLFP